MKPKLESFTVSHFKAYASRIVLDTGSYWVVEDFQLEIVEPILLGYTETWAVVPESNAKTTLMAGYALYHTDFTPQPWVPISASSRDQAEILARQAYGMIRATPGMSERFRIFEGYREIRSLRQGGRGIKVYAADTMTADGVIPTLCICDEGHRYHDLSLYRLWRGKLNKRGGQIVMISTAGEPGGEFEETRDKIRDRAPKRTTHGARIRSEGNGLIMNEWRVISSSAILDMKEVKKANPLSTITLETLQSEFESPTMDIGDWSRLKCNIPARTSTAAITDAEWDGGMVDFPLPPEERIDVGVDVAWKHDTFAFTPCWNALAEGWFPFRLLGAPTILTPPGDGSMLPVDTVKSAFENINDVNPVDTVVMDTQKAEDIAQWLSDEMGVTVIDREQGNLSAAEDYEFFMRALRNGTLKHTGHIGLRQHAMNAVARPLPNDKKRFDRASTSRAAKKQMVRVIDALTAAAMVNWFQADQTENGGKLAGSVEDYRVTQL